MDKKSPTNYRSNSVGLKEPEVAKTVKGVSISQHEEFVAKPAELEIEIATQVDKLKKAAS